MSTCFAEMMHEANYEEESSLSMNDVRGKLFVGGLAWQTTVNSLRTYFGKYGELVDVALMIDKRNGKPRGFGFVKMRYPEDADRAVLHTHIIDGRQVDVKRALPREKAPCPIRAEASKIFVGGLPSTVGNNELDTYFKQFGDVKDSVVMMDRATGNSRGFGFVTFEREEALVYALSVPHVILGRRVEIRRAEALANNNTNNNNHNNHNNHNSKRSNNHHLNNHNSIASDNNNQYASDPNDSLKSRYSASNRDTYYSSAAFALPPPAASQGTLAPQQAVVRSPRGRLTSANLATDYFGSTFQASGLQNLYNNSNNSLNHNYVYSQDYMIPLQPLSASLQGTSLTSDLQRVSLENPSIYALNRDNSGSSTSLPYHNYGGNNHRGKYSNINDKDDNNYQSG